MDELKTKYCMYASNYPKYKKLNSKLDFKFKFIEKSNLIPKHKVFLLR